MDTPYIKLLIWKCYLLPGLSAVIGTDYHITKTCCHAVLSINKGNIYEFNSAPGIYDLPLGKTKGSVEQDE